eukprot:SAG31_NODE_1178_length_9531_cov_3.040818_1_plen_708_part_10
MMLSARGVLYSALHICVVQGQAPQAAPSSGAFQGLDHPFGSNSSSCNVAELPTRINNLNSACCGSEPSNIHVQNCQFACSVDCMTVIIPLLNDCAPVLNKIYDRAATDTMFDGQASGLVELQTRCYEIPTEILLNDLQELVEAGRCAPESLDGVAATDIKAAACEDTSPHDCGQMLSTGIFTCDVDFCNSVVPQCPNAGQCDSTCGFCPDDTLDDGGHRRQLAALQQQQTALNRRGERRRAQNLMQCLPTYFESQMTTVSQACDTPQGSIPSECDARCAIVFDTFWTRCMRQLSNMVGQSELRQWEQFYMTCTAALPPEPLVHAVVQCAGAGDRVNGAFGSPAPPVLPEDSLLSMPFPTNSTCNIGLLPSRITHLNEACCSGNEEQGCGPCDTACALVLLPLLDDCANILDQLYDHADGLYDGSASVLTDLRAECISILPADIITHIVTMRAHGDHAASCLSDQVLDGLATTEVKGVVCEDVDERCDALLACGILTCERDFCNSEPSCHYAGLCDRTCDMCPSEMGGGAGRRTQALMDISIALGDCNPQTFPAEVAVVDQACCDADTHLCEEGTPTECDAKCAIVYDNFFPRCQHLLSGIVTTPAVMRAFGRLYVACTEQLPTEPLLRAILNCSNGTHHPVTPPVTPVTPPPPAPPPTPSPILNNATVVPTDGVPTQAAPSSGAFQGLDHPFGSNSSSCNVAELPTRI